jgi:hypothetical protein
VKSWLRVIAGFGQNGGAGWMDTARRVLKGRDQVDFIDWAGGG